MIVAIWKSGDCSKELLALLKEFALEAGLEPAAAGYDGYDLDVLGGTHVWIRDPDPALVSYLGRRHWEIWSEARAVSGAPGRRAASPMRHAP